MSDLNGMHTCYGMFVDDLMKRYFREAFANELLACCIF